MAEISISWFLPPSPPEIKKPVRMYFIQNYNIIVESSNISSCSTSYHWELRKKEDVINFSQNDAIVFLKENNFH